MWWPPDSDVVATTSLSGGHHILSGAPHIIWWPLDSDVVATTSLSGGHQILSGGHQIAMYVVFFVLLVQVCGGHQIAM